MPRYAWSDPYGPLRERLTGLADRLRARGARCAVFVDSNHHVDRDAAVRAGLAFSARNTMAIVPGEGSFVALGAIVTDASSSRPRSSCRRAAAPARCASTPARRAR